MKGIDVSTYQRKLTDMDAVKKDGIGFAIIKIGEYFTKQDAYFETHYKRFTGAGIPVGVYLFSHAESVASAKKEAEFVAKILNGRELQLPVFLDVEAKDSALNNSKSKCIEVCEAFCDTIEGYGYASGVYTSASPWSTHLDAERFHNKGRCVWVANYGVTKPNISYYDIWQYDCTETVANVVCDTNVLTNESLIQTRPIDMIAEAEDNIAEEEAAETVQEDVPTLSAADLIAVAISELGYYEKNDKNNLDDPSVKGNGNYTKYARDLDAINYFSVKVQGQAYCSTFVSWCAYQMCGKDAEKARKILCQTKKGASWCPSAAQYYRSAKRLDNKPQAGDQVFYGEVGNEYHTGIVEFVSGDYVHTIEGNYRDFVCRRSWKWKGSSAQFGHPNYDVVEKVTVPETPQNEDIKPSEDIASGSVSIDTSKADNAITCSYALNNGAYSKAVLALQALLTYHGFSCTADGYFGNSTESKLKAFQKANGIEATGVCTNTEWLLLIQKG